MTNPRVDGGGSGHCSDHVPPTENPMKAQARRHVLAYVSECEGEELELRASILIARDYAAAKRCVVTSQAALGYAADAHEMAGAYAFAPASIDLLKMVLGYCRALVLASGCADTLLEGGVGR